MVVVSLISSVKKVSVILNGPFSSNEFSVRNNSVLKMDLLLRSVLYACLFYLLAHPDTLSSVAKNIPGVKKANSFL